MSQTVTLQRAVSYYGPAGLVDYAAGAEVAVADIEPSVLAQWKHNGTITGYTPTTTDEAELAQGHLRTKIGQPVELKFDSDPILGQETTGTIVTSIEEGLTQAEAEAAKTSEPGEIKVEGNQVAMSTPIEGLPPVEPATNTGDLKIETPAAPQTTTIEQALGEESVAAPGKVTRAKGGK